MTKDLAVSRLTIYRAILAQPSDGLQRAHKVIWSAADHRVKVTRWQRYALRSQMKLQQSRRA